MQREIERLKFKKLLIGVIAVAVLFLGTGCTKDTRLTEEESKTKVVDLLDDKYGNETFEVQSMELVEGGAKYIDYYYCFQMKAQNGEEFYAQISENGGELCDTFEKTMYQKDIEDEVQGIVDSVDGLQLEKIDFTYNEMYDKSLDVDEYKLNEGVIVELYYALPYSEHTEMVKDFYSLADKLQTRNYCFTIIVDNGATNNWIAVGKERNYVTIEEVEHMISRLEE